jgi:hypothetical protein
VSYYDNVKYSYTFPKEETIAGVIERFHDDWPIPDLDRDDSIIRLTLQGQKMRADMRLCDIVGIQVALDHKSPIVFHVMINRKDGSQQQPPPKDDRNECCVIN